MHDRRLLHLHGQIAADLGDGVTHFLRCNLHVLVEIEIHGDLCAAVAHRRLQLVDAGDPGEAVLDGIEDLTLDAFRRRTRVCQHDADDRELHIG